MIEVAIENAAVAHRVNWGSLDSALLTRMMDENSLLPEPKDAREVTLDAMVPARSSPHRPPNATAWGMTRSFSGPR